MQHSIILSMNRVKSMQLSAMRREATQQFADSATELPFVQPAELHSLPICFVASRLLLLLLLLLPPHCLILTIGPLVPSWPWQ